MFDGGIGELDNHKDDTRDNLDWVCVDIFNMLVVEVISIQVRLKVGLV